jgi:hypothetical protein
MARKTSGGVAAVARLRYWRNKEARIAVEAWQRSGQTLAEFSRRHRIRPRRLGRWANRLSAGAEAPGAKVEPVHFHPVRLVTAEKIAEESHDPIEIVLGDGCVVRVPRGFLAADLSRVLQVLATEAGC